MREIEEEVKFKHYPPAVLSNWGFKKVWILYDQLLFIYQIIFSAYIYLQI
jgi:hypothetical protein